MTIEYVLQKKLLGRWDYVTWYDENELDKAQRSFESVSKGDTGYSWRLVKLETLQEKLLADVKEIEPPSLEDEDAPVVKASWGEPSTQKESWSSNTEKKDHGLTGSVWIGNPTTKEKKRVPAAEAASMMEQGWIKAGPRTVL